MIIQIYALSNTEDAILATKLGVDQIGFVAGEYGKVHGELSFEACMEITNALRGKGTSVALTMSTNITEIVDMVKDW